MFTEYIDFISNPKEKICDDKETSYFQVVTTFVLFWICSAFLYGLLIMIINYFDSNFNQLRKTTWDLFFKNPWLYLTMVTIHSPMIEELGFRLGLKIKKTFLTLSFSIQVYYILFFVIKLGNNIDIILLKFFILLLFVYLSYRIIGNKFINKIRKHYKSFVYFNIIFFAVLHATNYSYSFYSDYFYIPILVFPQLLIGSYLSFIRIKYGVILAIFLHFALNLLIMTPLIFKQLF